MWAEKHYPPYFKTTNRLNTATPISLHSPLALTSKFVIPQSADILEGQVKKYLIKTAGGFAMFYKFEDSYKVFYIMISFIVFSFLVMLVL